jgi:type II secretory pathway pseudopilin PulG
MKASIYRRRRSAKTKRGFTLLELIIAAILSILTLMALPLARVTIQREKEKELRRALWEMRDVIDNYKQEGERGAFQIKADSGGYPVLSDLGAFPSCFTFTFGFGFAFGFCAYPMVYMYWRAPEISAIA